jgi:hypothetical protein
MRRVQEKIYKLLELKSKIRTYTSSYVATSAALNYLLLGHGYFASEIQIVNLYS